MHFSGELVGKFLVDRRPLASVCLNSDITNITAIGNDYGFEKIFSRQCESMLRKNDVVFAITTSGESKNIIECLKVAKKKGVFVVGLTGLSGKRLRNYSDIILFAPSKLTARIQEIHRVILHIICELVEREITENK